MTSAAVKGAPPNGKPPTPARSWGARWGRIELTGDYAGWHAEMRLNPELSVWEDFSSGEDERFNSALKYLIRSWNLTDDDGHAIPTPAEGLDWAAAPFDLKLNLTNAYTAAVTARMSPPKETSMPSEPTSPSAT